MRTFDSIRRKVIFGLGLANLLVCVLAMLFVDDSRQQYEMRTRMLTQNIAQAIDHNLSSSINKIDMALNLVQFELEQQLAGNAIDLTHLTHMIEQVENKLPEIEAIRVSDRQGLAWLGKGVSADHQVDWSDRDHFRLHADHGGDSPDRLHVSKPLQGRLARQPIIVLSRAYHDAGGNFAGIILATVPIAHFSETLAKYSLGEHGMLILRDSDLGLIARHPPWPDRPTGQLGNRQVSAEMSAVAASGVTEVHFNTRQSLDGNPRLFHMRRLGDKPMMVLVGIAEEGYLKDWRDDRVRTYGAALAFLVFSLLLGRLLIHSLHLAHSTTLALKEQHIHLEERVEERTAALSAAEARNRQIIESTGEGIIEVDPSGRILLANPAAARIVGHAEDKLVGYPLHAMLHHRHPDGRPFPDADCPDALAIREGRPVPPKNDVYWHAEGHPVPVYVTTAPILADGKILGAVVSFQDISARLQAERNNAFLAALVENSDDIIVIKDLHLRVLAANMAYARASGHAHPEELIGRTDAEIFGVQEDLEPIRTYMADERQAQTLKPGEFLLREEPVISPDWTFRHVLTKKYPIFDQDGRLIGTGNISIDITARKEAEEAGEAARLTTERLARAKSQFLANMSHEIRTPINAVLGFSRIGMRDCTETAMRETFERIHVAGSHLLGVVNDVLDFSKIEAGKLALDERPFQLDHLLDSARNLMLPTAAQKGLEFRVDQAGSLPTWVLGDEQRVLQILINLLSNAFKFTSSGAVSLHLAGDADKVQFQVADSGIGMNEEEVARLFRPFEQADASATRRFGGTGLGLVISKTLTEQMGGTIHVASQPGKGSTFTVSLPLPASAAPPLASAPADVPSDPLCPAHPPAQARQPLSGLRILAAEDEPFNRLILEDLLLKAGARCTLIENGMEAVGQVARQPDAYDVVLMDIQMPIMDGYQATEEIRRIAPALPVIGLTAHALQEDRERCFAAGMVEHLTKPIDPATLIAALGQLGLTDAAPARGAVPPAPTLGPHVADEASEAAGEIDFPALETRFADQPEFVDELLKALIEGHASTPARLRQHAEQNALEALRPLAHRIKGLAANLGADGIRKLAADTERDAKEGLSSAPQLANQLADRFDTLLAAVRQRLGAAS